MDSYRPYSNRESVWFGNEKVLQSIQLILREVLIASQIDDMLLDITDDNVRPGLKELVKYATIVIATLPVICVYPFLQKFFVKGVMIGAIKQ